MVLAGLYSFVSIKNLNYMLTLALLIVGFSTLMFGFRRQLVM